MPRKDARKQEREARKQKKAAYFSVNNKKRLAEEEHHESPQRKKPRQASSAEPRVAVFSKDISPAKAKESLVTQPPPAPVVKTHKLTKSKIMHAAERSSHPMAKGRIDNEEDAYISYLESQLGYSKSGKKKRIADDDGLDGMNNDALCLAHGNLPLDLLDWADGFTVSIPKVCLVNMLSLNWNNDCSRQNQMMLKETHPMCRANLMTVTLPKTATIHTKNGMVLKTRKEMRRHQQDWLRRSRSIRNQLQVNPFASPLCPTTQH